MSVDGDRYSWWIEQPDDEIGDNVGMRRMVKILGTRYRSECNVVKRQDERRSSSQWRMSSESESGPGWSDFKFEAFDFAGEMERRGGASIDTIGPCIVHRSHAVITSLQHSLACMSLFQSESFMLDYPL
jgi:hypothetical protein